MMSSLQMSPRDVDNVRQRKPARPTTAHESNSVARNLASLAFDVDMLPFAACRLVQSPNALVVQVNSAWRLLEVAPIDCGVALAVDFARSFGLSCGLEGFSAWMERSAEDQSRHPFRAEFSGKSSNHWHELRCYRMHGDPATGSMSSPANWLLTLTDVTERIERERAHREHETQLFYASKVMSVGEMAAVISHELNHPLATCINFLNGINRKLGSGTDEMRALQAPIQTAAAQAERAVQIVARIREFVRAREPKRTEVNIAQLFETVKRWIQRDSAAAQVAVEIKVSRQLPLLHVDRVMIEQVMVNLAKNAIEALCTLPAVGIAKSITLGAALSSDDSATAELWVADSGQGLSEGTQSSLFSPFTSSKQQGMGIGLSICRSIVEFHRGRLWYEPSDVGGAKFIFTLPVTDLAE
jgi:C4-dicarboxylate-specific signal transduction histidine kinase